MFLFPYVYFARFIIMCDASCKKSSLARVCIQCNVAQIVCQRLLSLVTMTRARWRCRLPPWQHDCLQCRIKVIEELSQKNMREGLFFSLLRPSKPCTKRNVGILSQPGISTMFPSFEQKLNWHAFLLSLFFVCTLSWQLVKIVLFQNGVPILPPL